jgi:hypothetical protein
MAVKLMLDSTTRLIIWSLAFIVAVGIHVAQARSRKAEQDARIQQAVDEMRFYPQEDE